MLRIVEIVDLREAGAILGIRLENLMRRLNEMNHRQHLEQVTIPYKSDHITLGLEEVQEYLFELRYN